MNKKILYLLLLAGGLIAILFLVEEKIFQKEISEPKSIVAWGGNVKETPLFSLDEKITSDIYESTGDSKDAGMPQFFSNKIFAAISKPDTDNDSKNSFNPLGNAISKSLPKTFNSNETTSSPNFFDNPYNLLPRGLVKSSIAELPKAPLTSEQKVLFDYGNAVGVEIRSFDASHVNTSEVLDAFFKDYKNPAKAASVLALSRDYERLADSIGALKNIPAELSDVHSRLAAGYKPVARGFVSLTKAKTDNEMADAILSYDAAAEEFIKAFIRLSEFLALHEIKFSESDPGYIFQFAN